MSRTMLLRGLALGVISAWVMSGCDGPTTAERCADLEDWIEGYEQNLDRDCRVDTDCRVAFIRPDHPLPTSTPAMADPRLSRVLAEHEDSCGGFPGGSGIVQSICVERIIDVPNEGSAGGTVDQILDRVCQLRGSFQVDAPDAGGDAGIDGGDVGIDGSGDRPCACTSDAACGGGTCFDCSCAPATLCGDACLSVARCDRLESLNLGLDVASCAGSCESVVGDGVAYEQFANCLRTQACDTLQDCGQLLP